MSMTSTTPHTPSTPARAKPELRLANTTAESHGWRIGEITSGFALEDVWRIPVEGDANDFGALIEIMTTGDDLMDSASLPARVLWHARDRLGAWFGLGRIEGLHDGDALTLPIPDSDETTLRGRLPDDLRDTVDGVRFADVPFVPLYRTDDEFAAELSNRTVHAVMHLGWVADDINRVHGEMAAYVKPRGTFGHAYMAFIKPFRRLVVYPALMRQIARAWTDRPAPQEPSTRRQHDRAARGR